jgi:hypothetical protein
VVIEVVIPRETELESLSSHVDLDSLEVRDKVKVIIQRRKMEWGNAKLNAIGKIVSEFTDSSETNMVTKYKEDIEETLDDIQEDEDEDEEDGSQKSGSDEEDDNADISIVSEDLDDEDDEQLDEFDQNDREDTSDEENDSDDEI